MSLYQAHIFIVIDRADFWQCPFNLCGRQSDLEKLLNGFYTLCSQAWGLAGQWALPVPGVVPS